MLQSGVAIQVAEMWSSSCMGFWTPPWAGSPMASQAHKPLLHLIKGLMFGWATPVQTLLVNTQASIDILFAAGKLWLLQYSNL